MIKAAFRLSILAVTLLSNHPQLMAQNLFPSVMEGCKFPTFCLDCGQTKADANPELLRKMLDDVAGSTKLGGIKGLIMVQIIVDSTGKGCVLSHTDESNHPISVNLTSALNKFTGFIAPVSGAGLKEAFTSFNMVFTIEDGKITGRVDRVDMDAFKASFDKPNKPEIYNTRYKYENQNLAKYNFRVWNSRNSNLPDNMNDHISVDKQQRVWLTYDGGLTRFDGSKFTDMKQDITTGKKNFSYGALASSEEVMWVSGSDAIYSFNGSSWTRHDSKQLGFEETHEITENKKTGELIFSTDAGVHILKNKSWTKVGGDQYKLPSQDIFYAQRDSRGRLWIGSFDGAVMIDGNGIMTDLTEGNKVLKGKTITSMAEDENGNLYFGLYEFKSKGGKVNRNEGIAILSSTGDWKQLTTENSGMPFNHTTGMVYDDTEKVLWISTDRAGLVRYDLQNGWENYHSDNSDIPTSYISAMTVDSKGTLYLATRQGLVKVERR